MKYTTVSKNISLLLLVLSGIGCGPNPENPTPTPTSTATEPFSIPSVLSNTPLDSATNVALNGFISAIFSEPMDAETLTTSTFTLEVGTPPVTVAGQVIYADAEVVFWPAEHLDPDTEYTATIGTGAESSNGIGLAQARVWRFQTGTLLAPGLRVNLGTAGNYVLLAKSAISTVPTSNITGDLGISPAAASYITGFSLTMDATNVFSTSSQVTGRVFAADYAAPTSANLTTAIGDMELAFADAAGRAPDFTELGAGDLGGMTLDPGVYKFGTGVLIPTDLTLTGNANDVWIFQIAQNLTVSSAVIIHLTGGALPKNVFWQVAGAVDIGTTAHFEGIVLSQTAIDVHTGGSINGRLLAQTAVNIDANAVLEPVE